MSKPAKRVALSFTTAFVCLALAGTAWAAEPAKSAKKATDVEKMSAPKPKESQADKPMEGQVPPPTMDTNEDGKMDAWDRDANGIADAWDVNGDNKPDVMDNDGDGKPDDGKATPPPPEESQPPR